MRDINLWLNQFKDWASNHDDVLAALLVGSHTRGMASDDSDIDLILICETPQRYLEDEAWLQYFGHVLEVQDEDWGLVQSKRVFYDNGIEVEFGLTTAQWAAAHPVDTGTQAVVANGAEILTDPKGMLESLLRAVSDQNTQN